VEYSRIVEAFLSEAGKISSKIVITSHVNTDPDGLAAALALGWFFASRGFEVKYCFPGISMLSRRLLQTLQLEIEPAEKPNAFSLVVCDTSSDAVLGECKHYVDDARVTLLVDHHAPGPLVASANYVVSTREPATSTIVARIFLEYNQPPPQNIATLLLAGILYDTKRFQLASVDTFKAAAFLLKTGDYVLAQKLLTEEMSRSERLARLKGAARALVLDVCGYLIAVTRVSAYEASVARALIALGADIAIVVGGSKREVRASVRVSKKALEAGIRIDEVLERIKGLPGGGGGHPGAGGYNVSVESRRAADKMRGVLSREILVETLRDIFEFLC